MTEFADIPLSEIRTDGGTQPRAALDYMAIAEYAEEYAGTLDMMPAVTVFYDGSAYWLADGFHRYGAAEKAGKNDIHAEILQGTRRDAVLYSCGANADHGLRRTDADKRRAVLTLLHDAEWSKWSDREIARKCKVGHQMVAPLRADLTGRATSERAYKTRHGTTAKMKTAGINADRRQRELKPVRIVERPHQQPAAPVHRVEPSELGANAALDAAEEAVERRREFLASWEKLAPADREWAYQTVLHWKNSLPAHDSNTGEIIEEPNSSGCQDAVGAGQLSTPSGVEHGQAAPTMRRFLDPITGEAVDMMVKDGEIPPGLLAVTLRTFPNPGDPLPGQGLDVAPRLTSGPDPLPDPAPKASVEGAADTGGVAASSNLSSDDWANSPEVRSAPEMPSFLRRTA